MQYFLFAYLSFTHTVHACSSYHVTDFLFLFFCNLPLLYSCFDCCYQTFINFNEISESQEVKIWVMLVIEEYWARPSTKANQVPEVPQPVPWADYLCMNYFIYLWKIIFMSYLLVGSTSVDMYSLWHFPLCFLTWMKNSDLAIHRNVLLEAKRDHNSFIHIATPSGSITKCHSKN